MSLRSILEVVSVVVGVVALNGCSAHQDHPATPMMSSATPTFRSSTNSYDQPNTPYYTQPGINGGTPAKLTPIAKVDRFDQNSPLALQVYAQLQTGLGVPNVRYMTVQAKGQIVLISGTVASKQLAEQAKAIAKKTQGVDKLIDKVEVQS